MNAQRRMDRQRQTRLRRKYRGSVRTVRVLSQFIASGGQDFYTSGGQRFLVAA